MKKKKNPSTKRTKKQQVGYTLIELLVAITVLGIILIMVVPQVENIREKNRQTKYKKYAETVATSGKLYVDSYADDLFGTNPTGCQNIQYSELKKKGLLKDIDIENVDCSGNGKTDDESSFVRVFKYVDHYSFDVAMYCKSTNNDKELYSQTLDNIDLCNTNAPDTTGPKLGFENRDLDYRVWDTGSKRYVYVRVWDEFGLLENVKIKYTWYWIDANGVEQNDGEKIYDFRNKRYAGKGTRKEDGIIGKIPFPTGDEKYTSKQFSLKVEAFDVRDANGNYSYDSFNTSTGPNLNKTGQFYWLDNLAPSCEVLDVKQDLREPNQTLGWTNKDRSIRIKCDDQKTTVMKKYGPNTKAEWEAPGQTIVGVGCKGSSDNTKTHTIKYLVSEGNKTITEDTYEISDKLGNKRKCHYGAYFDTEVPTCGSSNENTRNNEKFQGSSTKWLNTDVTIKLKCHDDKNSSGIGSGCYSGETIPEVFTKVYNRSSSDQSIDKDKLVIKDIAGNTNTCEYYARYDTIAPTCGSASENKRNNVKFSTFNAKAENSKWTNQRVEVAIKCKEVDKGKGASGCNSDQSDKTIFKKTYTSTHQSIKDDSLVISDLAGNTTTCTYGAYYDTIPPACGTTYENTENTYWRNSPFTAKVKCKEINEGTGASGCQLDYYTRTYNTNITVRDDYIYIKDYAQNVSKCPFNVYYDKEAPTVSSATGTTTKNDSSTRSVTIRTSASGARDVGSYPVPDGGTRQIDGSGEITYRYYLSTSSTKPGKSLVTNYSNVFYSNSCGTRYYGYAVAIDKVGNISNVFSLGSFVQDCCQTVDLRDGTRCTAYCDGGTYNQLAYSTYDSSIRCSAKDRDSGGSRCNTQSCCSSYSIKYLEGSSCSEECGGGTYNRVAYSSYPPGYTIRCPSYDTRTGGSSCNTQSCCSRTTTTWNSWGSCQGTCGYGTKYRSGSKYSVYNGQYCGNDSDSTSCYTGVDCCSSTTSSSSSSGCSASCGPGTETITTYYYSRYTGEYCDSDTSTRSCNLGACETPTPSNPGGGTSHTHKYGNYITQYDGNYWRTTASSSYSYSNCSCGSRHSIRSGQTLYKLKCYLCGYKNSKTWCPDDYGLV